MPGSIPPMCAKDFEELPRRSTVTNGALRAAIVGAGIGGLCAAIALRSRGIEVTVFEKASQLGEVGAGIMLYPNSLRQLERLGLGEQLERSGARIGVGSEYYRSDGTPVGAIVTTDSSGWNGMYGMHRADLLRILADALPEGLIRTNHHCVAVSQTPNAAELFFENGRTFDADIVVAADGIHSQIQDFVIEPTQPEYSGVRAYRGVIPSKLLPHWRPRAHQVWMGEGKHFMVFPLRLGTLLNYVGFVPTSDQTVESWSAIGNRDELAAAFAGWDPRITQLLKQVESCFWWGLYDRKPLATWVKKRVVLLGDAAHPMLPHLGQGANQAVEDGVALAVLLEGVHSSGVESALACYTRFRRKRTDLIQAEARRNGLRYDSKHADLKLRDQEVVDLAAFRRSLYDYDVEQAALSIKKSS